MQKDRFDRTLNFLLGASWAIVFFGALITFKIFLILGLGIAIFSTIIFIFIGLFLILGLDTFSVNRQKLVEIKKQTTLLEKIYKKQNTSNPLIKKF